MAPATYVGRFAPSPTGLLHFGSLLAAMASYCDARSHKGHWRLRIDDIDPPRAIPRACLQFQHTLRTYGFVWDGPVILQSERTEAYRQHLQYLNKQSRLYPCACSRRDLSHHRVYPGTCAPTTTTPKSYALAAKQVDAKLSQPNDQHAIRVVTDADVTFDDLIQGNQTIKAGSQLGDTVVVRRDNLFAYALACAVDDAGVSHVVRGADLLPTTAAQIHIMGLLNLKAPTYAHIPIALNHEQQKLSKQTQAEPIDAMPTLPTLQRAWRFLGQDKLNVNSVEKFWQAAISAWNINSVPKTTSSSYE